MSNGDKQFFGALMIVVLMVIVVLLTVEKTKPKNIDVSVVDSVYLDDNYRIIHKSIIIDGKKVFEYDTKGNYKCKCNKEK